MIDIPTYKFAVTEEVIEYCNQIKEDPNKFLPTRGRDKDTGWDVRCARPGGVTLHNGQYSLIPLGIRVFCPDGWWLKLKPRSSTFIKKNLLSLYGTIDELYEGQMGYAVCLHRDILDVKIGETYIPFGERIGQLIPVRRQEMIIEGVSNQEFNRLCKERNGVRGTGGFGSTGDK